MNKENVKYFGWILFSLISLATVVISIDAYFAKSIQVDAVQERLDLQITEDRVFQQQQQIQQMKNYQIFERQQSEPELTPLEAEAIKKAEEQLHELKAEKIRREQTYQQRKK